MKLDGFTWLLIIVAIFAFLYMVAKIREDRYRKQNPTSAQPAGAKKAAKQKHNRELSKLAKNLQLQLPDYNFSIRKNHLTVKKDQRKLAMITMDKKTAIGNRKLGEVMVLNYHRQPDHTQILEHLKKSA